MEAFETPGGHPQKCQRGRAGSTERTVGHLERTIKAIGLTVTGDVINLDYVPDLGTTLAVNGVSKGTAITGANFFTAVLGIFVGDNPVDTRLEQGLPGQ